MHGIPAQDPEVKPKMNTAWVTGAGGLIGSHLVESSSPLAPDWSIIPLHRHDLELTNCDAVSQRFKRDSPTLLIHCAAISNSSLCEEQPELAQRVNVDVAEFLADLFANGRMVLFSTDLVFDGTRGGYIESDATNPLGMYAKTKVEAEAAVLAHSQNLVIRTSLNGGNSPNRKRGFDEALRAAWKAGRTTRLFVDEFRCPIAAPVTALATWELALDGRQGIYHLAGSERLNRLQIGQLIAARHPELSPNIEQGSIKNFTGPPRAADCSLNCAKAESHLSFKLPGLTEWLNANSREVF